MIDNRYIFATTIPWRWLPSLLVGPPGCGFVWNFAWGPLTLTWKERE